ncbi:hypothetical protein O3M35_007481 [Rhynocoris fuscipes]|uniref:Uncharacterized protein n=1 Tax=Rhynocoris fuscipes TaxID=488301 RepID=A0AAW1DEV7_9HEMI
MKKKPSPQLLEVAQEITFAKALASNDKTIRDRALKRLKKWFTLKAEAKTQFTDDGFIRLWRGLFYNVWMSDKPLVQEEVVEGISNLIHCFIEFSDALSFIMGFFQILSDYWAGLDIHRMDKYLMFVRRFIRQTFKVIEKFEWKKKQISKLAEALKTAFTNAPLGLLMHVCEIYLEELAKVSKGAISKDIVPEFIKPFGEIMSKSSDSRIIKHISEYIYLYLLKQSDLGIKHEIKFREWKKLGCPEGSIKVMQEVDMDSDDEDFDNYEEMNGGSLDARAGHVNVLLPTLKFDSNAILKHLNVLKIDKTTSTSGRKGINNIITKYKTYERGKYPLGIHRVDIPDYEDEDEIIDNAAFELLEEEREMIEKDKPLIRRKTKKKRDRKNKGEWIVTPTKLGKSDKDESNTSIDNSNVSQNKWEVSISDDNNITTPQRDEPSVPKNKSIKRKLNKNGTSPKTLVKNEPCNKEKDQNDWGENAWEEDHEVEIVINPKRKMRHSDILPQRKLNSLIDYDKKNSSFSGKSSGKKVEFMLNRNSFQDEKEYKRCLKEKPVIKFDGDAEPPLGVLKSTPFSSPVNPFLSAKSFL